MKGESERQDSQILKALRFLKAGSRKSKHGNHKVRYAFSKEYSDFRISLYP